MGKSPTVGQYLIRSMEELGLRHVFGIPGDYILGFYDLLFKSKMEVIGTCTELGAGFAADAYARVNGLGALCVTYCVGGLNALNAVAGAYAEKSPLIVISGAPGLRERVRSPLLHHKVRDFNTQKKIYDQVTVASVSLEDPKTAADQIHEAISACLQFKRPVYIELPRDIVNQECKPSRSALRPKLKSDRDVLKEALQEAGTLLRAAKRPVILGGVEIHRFGLQEHFLRFVEKTGFPVAATLLGKSMISEKHPQYLGIYEGGMGREEVRVRVEQSDCVLILGAFLTDINLGIGTAKLDVGRTIHATSEAIMIKHHHYDGVLLKDFMDGLSRQNLGKKKKEKIRQRVVPDFHPILNKKMTVQRFFARMNSFLNGNSIVISDIGESLFGATDLVIHRRTEFLSPAYYTSMGFAVPATVGAQIGKKHLRPVVFVGDGAFQMTGQELSTIAKLGLNPILFVLNNKGYTTERFIMDGPYNDIHNWAYHLWPLLLQEGLGLEVKTEDELEKVLQFAEKNTHSFTLVNVHFDPRDCSESLERLARRLKKQGGLGKIGGKKPS